MKKSIALLLCLVLVLSLCACGAKESVVGTWNASVNMADLFNEQMASEPEMAEYVKLETLNFTFVLELKEDGTCTMKVDPDAMTAAIDQLVADLTAGMEAYFKDMFAAQGLEVDVNEALSSMGISLEDLVSEMKNELLSEESLAEFTTESKYKAEDGKMYFSDDLESEINTDEYCTYKLEGDTLTLEAGTMAVDAEDEAFAEYLFPMTLTRAK